jgi:hypothetical protein
LNQYVRRPIHPFPSATDLIRRIDPLSRLFAKIDAIHGYFQIPLEEESSALTTFLIPSGRYAYKAAPMGLAASGDEFCRRTDEAFQDMPWFLKIVDDGLIQAPDEQTLLQRVEAVLKRCREFGIKVSTKKFNHGPSIKFAGFIVGEDGVRPDPEKVDGIRNFPIPTTLTQLRSFLGLAQQFSIFTPELAFMRTKLNGLLRRNVAFVWLPEHQAEFEEMKRILCSDLLVKSFDPSLPTSLLVDASRLYGVGYALVQHAQEGTRLISCNSAHLSPAQKNYAMVELEALAIMWGVHNCNYYLRGMTRFTVLTDHQPLVGIFKQNLQDLKNQRISRFRGKLVDFNFDVVHTSGKSNLIADALSRSPVWSSVDDGEVVNEALCWAIAEDPAFQFLYDAAKADDVYQLILTVLKEDKSPVDFQELTPYLSVWPRL